MRIEMRLKTLGKKCSSLLFMLAFGEPNNSRYPKYICQKARPGGSA